MEYENLKNGDELVYITMLKEIKRVNAGLELIPSENFPSKATLEVLGSIFNNKYSEGYPGKRYYGGNKFINVIENLAIEKAKKLLGYEPEWNFENTILKDRKILEDDKKNI